MSWGGRHVARHMQGRAKVMGTKERVDSKDLAKITAIYISVCVPMAGCKHSHMITRYGRLFTKDFRLSCFHELEVQRSHTSSSVTEEHEVCAFLFCILCKGS